MLKISKLADYGTVIMAALARVPGATLTAKELAERTRLNLPTVSKLLKRLVKAHLLVSNRGSKGGYSLAKSASQITVMAIVSAIDGVFAMTECSIHQGHCDIEKSCMVSDNWRLISQAVYYALESITLAQMTHNQIAKAQFKPVVFSKLGLMVNDDSTRMD